MYDTADGDSEAADAGAATVDSAGGAGGHGVAVVAAVVALGNGGGGATSTAAATTATAAAVGLCVMVRDLWVCGARGRLPFGSMGGEGVHTIVLVCMAYARLRP